MNPIFLKSITQIITLTRINSATWHKQELSLYSHHDISISSRVWWRWGAINDAVFRVRREPRFDARLATCLGTLCFPADNLVPAHPHTFTDAILTCLGKQHSPAWEENKCQDEDQTDTHTNYRVRHLFIHSSLSICLFVCLSVYAYLFSFYTFLCWFWGGRRFQSLFHGFTGRDKMSF